MLTKQQYLSVREGLIYRNIPIPFLQQWCIEENRGYNELQTIFNTAIQNNFLDFIIGKIIRYFDKKFFVTVVYDLKTSKELKVF